MSKEFHWFSGAVLGSVLIIAIFLLPGCGVESTRKGVSEYSDRDLKAPDAANEGVVLAWKAGRTPVKDKVNEISVGQTLVVRIRNLDGWLIRRLRSGVITGEPSMSPKQKKTYLSYQDQLESFKGKAFDNFVNDIQEGDATDVGAKSGVKLNGVTFHDLQEAGIAYDTLLNVVKRGLFLVMNNSQFRGINAENPDASIVTSKELEKKTADTIHEMEFRLRRVLGDEDAWGNLYDGTQAVREVSVSLGIELDKNIYVLDTAVSPRNGNKAQQLRIELFQNGWLWSVLAGLALLLFFGIRLAAKTPLLRDTDLPLRADGYPQFSLARMQLAFWTYLAVGAFLVIWLVTDRLDTLNATILALLGISSGTALASKLANSITLDGGGTRADPERAGRRHKCPKVLREELRHELRMLEAEAAKIEEKRREAPAKGADAELESLCARIESLRDDLDYLKQHGITRFFLDLLSDNGRVTLHRLQVLLWTAVLGVVFITKVKRELSMPVFSETLLGLMGLSSATYIALKVPELKKTQADANASAKSGEA